MKKVLDWVCHRCYRPLEVGDVVIRFGSDDDPHHFSCVYREADAGVRDLLRGMLLGRAPALYVREKE